MQIQITIFLLFIVSCSCSVQKRIYRPERVQSPVQPGEQVVGVTEPECKFQGDNGQCCLSVSIAGVNGIENCVKVGQEQNKGFAAYIFSGHELVRKDLKDGKTCFPIPNTPFKACIHIYYSNIDNTGTQGNVCMYVSINRVISLDFNCIRFNNGTFQHNKEHTPESQGIFNMEFANGKSNIIIGKPIED